MRSLFSTNWRRPETVFPVLFFVALLLVGVSLFKDFGVSWDEHSENIVGLLSFNYVFHGDWSLLRYVNRDYGVSFGLLLVVIEKALRLTDPREIFLMRHFCTFLLFYAAVAAFYFLGKQQFDSWRAALFGCLCLVLTPRIFGNSFFDSKDISLLSAFIIGVFTLTRFLAKTSGARALAHAVVCAFAIDMRVVGVLIPGLTLFFLAWKSRRLKAFDVNLSEFVATVALFAMLTVLFTVLFWPFLWEHPLTNFLFALKNMSHFRWPNTVLYLGRRVAATDLPWHYEPVWMAISTPILYSVGFVVGLFAVARSFLTRPREILADAKNRNNVLFLTWFFTPVLAVVLLKSVVYDSWRHLFFIYPAFLLVAVQGLQWLIAVARRRAACLHFALIAAVALVTLHTAVVMARLHPFEYLYFNMLAGRDMATAQRRFDFDYWGLSYRKGLEWVLKNDPRDKVKIYVTEAPGLTNAFLTPPPQRKRLQYVYSVDQADYVLSTRRWPGPGDNCPDKRYAVMVGNAEALVVCRR